MILLLVAILLVLVAVYMVYPLMASAEPSARSAACADSAEARSILQEIEFDRERGTLDDETRAEMAARVSGQLGAPAEELSDEIEREVARLRDSEIEARVASLRAPATVAPAAQARARGAQRCPRCGSPRAPADKFCGKCGARFSKKAQ